MTINVVGREMQIAHSFSLCDRIEERINMLDKDNNHERCFCVFVSYMRIFFSFILTCINTLLVHQLVM